MNKKRLRLYLLLAIIALIAGWLLLEQGGIVMPELPAAELSSSGEPISQAPLSPEDAAPGLLQVYFFDVGQGDSQLVRVPDGDSWWNMLIDTGEYAYADGLTSALRELGVERIDALVNTHQHTDHMGCMARIIQRFDVGAFYMPELPEEQVPTTSAYTALLKRVEEKDLTAVPLREGTVIDCPDTLTLTVVASDPEARWTGLNNYSGVIRLQWGETSFLFTGDAEKQSEQVMLYSGEELAADVLKVGHHGSSTSTSQGFLDAVSPRWAVISCGKDNEYGHPHRETVAILSEEERGITTYRTDQNGTILALSDGRDVTWQTGLPGVAEKIWDN